jgi:hypothetical protein
VNGTPGGKRFPAVGRSFGDCATGKGNGGAIPWPPRKTARLLIFWKINQRLAPLRNGAHAPFWCTIVRNSLYF